MRLNRIWISLAVVSLILLLAAFLFKTSLEEYYKGTIISIVYLWAISWVALFVATRSLKSNTGRRSANMLLSAVTIKMLFSMMFLLIVYAANREEVGLFAYPFIFAYIVYLGLTTAWMMVISKKSNLKRKEN